MNELLLSEFNGEEGLVTRAAFLSTACDIQAFQFGRYTTFIKFIRERVDGARSRAMTYWIRTFHKLTSQTSPESLKRRSDSFDVV